MTKWAALAASALLAAIWIGSEWTTVGYWDGLTGRDVSIARGCAFVGTLVTDRASPRAYGVRVSRSEGPWWWWFHSGSSGPKNWFVAVPLWTLLAPMLAATAAVWRLDAMARRCAPGGTCLKCGYDLTGLPPGGPCPECGRGRG